MDWYLREQEKLQSLIRRYEAPDEYPFFPDALQKPILQPLDYPRILHPNTVNVNDKIRDFYVNKVLPAVCPDFGHGDRGVSQENYGSSATCDIACLQALSRRIHFGKFVAESKFQAEPEKYTKLIQAGDREGLGNAIFNKAVEQQIFERLRRKARTYGTDPTTSNGAPEHSKIKVESVVEVYRDVVMYLTKEVEVEYLMQRLGPGA